MYPVLFSVGPITFHTYGLIIALGVVAGFLFARRICRQNNLDWPKLRNIGIVTVIAAFIGAKVMFLLTAGNAGMPSDIGSGNVFYGVPLFAIPTFWLMARYYKFAPAVCAEIAILGIALAQSIGRLGCLMGGCCYGKPTTLPFSIKLYSVAVPPDLRGVPLHPIQLYSSLAEFAMFLFLYWQYRKPHRAGTIVLLYFVSYGIIRFLEELLRGDDFDRGMWSGWSTSQIISLISAFIAAVLLLRLRRVPAPA